MEVYVVTVFKNNAFGFRTPENRLVFQDLEIFEKRAHAIKYAKEQFSVKVKARRFKKITCYSTGWLEVCVETKQVR